MDWHKKAKLVIEFYNSQFAENGNREKKEALPLFNT